MTHRSHLLALFLGTVLLCVMMRPVSAQGTTDAALAAWREGNPAAARALLRPLAEAGDTAAQVLLASLLFNGDGGPRDPAAALALYQRAAEAGAPEAMMPLAMGLADGWAGAPDPAAARRWMEAAAQAGDPRALHALALDTPGADADPREAFRAAAEAGSLPAMAQMAALSSTPMEAFTWWQRAAEAGHAPSQLKVAQYLLNGVEGVVAADPARAVALFTQAARRNDSEAHYALGALHSTGQAGVGQDPVAAAVWLSLAVQAGHEQAGGLLAQISPHLTPTQQTAVQARVQAFTASLGRP